MRKQALWLALLLPALFFSVGARSAKPMYEPPPVEVPGGISQEDAAKSISKAVMGRGWTIDSKDISERGPSLFTASLHVRKHSLTIRIEFDTEQITFHYVESENLGFKEKDGVKYIHPKYTTWIKNIELDLAVELQNYSS